jgi:flagellar hook-associated protein 3 FlgL
MTISTISTSSLTSVLSQSVSSLQTQLANAELELSTGQDADIGLTLGAETGQSISLQQQNSYLQTLTTTNNTAGTRLSTTQNVLSNMQTTAQDFLNSLIENNGSNSTSSAMQTSATADLQATISDLNSQLDGSYIFAGTNTSNAPISNYFATGSANAAAVNSAITTAFPSSPDLSSVSASSMTSFLNNQFDALFTGDWSTASGSGWSSASDTTLTSQISTSSKQSTSVSANQTAFRQLTEAYTMVSSLGSQNLSSDAYQAVVTKAQSLLSSAITGLTDIQTNVGVVQSAITNSNTQMSAQMTVFSTQIDNLDSADAYDAATKVNNLQTQIETAYSLTNQLKQLSLVNYIS